jgi:hypothetical protein
LKIKQAFFVSLGGIGAGGRIQEGSEVHPIEYKKDWAVRRKIDDVNGVKYSCVTNAARG